MSPIATLVIGLGIATVVVLSWLGGILYLRQLRDNVRPAAALAQPDAQAPSIEAWIARAAALPEGKQPQPAGPREQSRLHHLAARCFPQLDDPHPHLHLMGITGVEKRLLTWVCQQTGLPNPFDALERLTGDPDEIRRAVEAWQDAHDDAVTVIDQLCAATATLRAEWTDPQAERFFPILSDYLTELDALVADLKTTGEALHGLQAEAALAEGTIVGLINLLVGSFGGYLVEAIITAGTMTPAVAAQAQLELTWVLKQIARALSKLPAVYSNARHILQSVTGFKGLDQMRERFQIAEVQKIERSLDSAA
ncbi:MAG TPA: hypothetical protein VJT31_35905 [Rugosimonospora sp.]|nr:hypothetical protein [Rugosimonospora sp.]